MMFVVINGDEYRENNIISYDNAYGHIKGVVKYGEWNQNGSGGEYRSVPCYGWYVEFVDLTPFEYEDDTKEEILEYYPEFEKTQSLLYLITDCSKSGLISNFKNESI